MTDALRARGAQQLAQAATILRQLRDVVAERLAETAGLEEVPLHVDDQERRTGEVQRDSLGLCLQ